MSKQNNDKYVLPPMSKEALDNLPFGAYVINQDGIIEFFNKKMAEISGVKEAREIEGQNIFQIPTYKKYRLLPFIERGLSGQPFQIKRIQYVSHVGKKESFRDYYGIPIKDEEGRVIKLLCIAEDASMQRELEEQVVANLREKEALLEEAQRRAESNAKIVNRLLDLQSVNIKDEKALKLIQEIKEQTKSILSVQREFYQAKNLAKINFKEYVEKLADNLFAIYNIDRSIINLKIYIDEIDLSIDQAIPCALVIKELVSNSLKHAFPGGRPGEVWIALKSADEKNYELSVSDDGVGFSSALDINTAKTLGIALVNTLAEQIGGTISIAYQKGIEIKIKFPKNL